QAPVRGEFGAGSKLGVSSSRTPGGAGPGAWEGAAGTAGPGRSRTGSARAAPSSLCDDEVARPPVVRPPRDAARRANRLAAPPPGVSADVVKQGPIRADDEGIGLGSARKSASQALSYWRNRLKRLLTKAAPLPSFSSSRATPKTLPARRS